MQHHYLHIYYNSSLILLINNQQLGPEGPCIYLLPAGLLIFCFFAVAFFITRSFHDHFFGSTTPTNTSTMTTAKHHILRLLLFFCSFSVPSFSLLQHYHQPVSTHETMLLPAHQTICPCCSTHHHIFFIMHLHR